MRFSYCQKKNISIAFQNKKIKHVQMSVEEICHWPGFKPAPYVARYKWVWIEDIHKMKKTDWGKDLQQSYELVKNKLPLKLRKQLDLQ
jgi:predicted DNA-binding protein (MmcQ/YjbR family)